MDAVGPFQMCAGQESGCEAAQESGCEAAIHVMHQTFADTRQEDVLQVDVNKASNSINIQAALHNISVICPSFSQILSNTYTAPVRCVIQGNGEIPSPEGTTQGDPLAMAMYALAVKLLNDRLQADFPSVTQVWYVYNASGATTCSELRAWWDSLMVLGHGFGYYPNSTKTHSIVKDEHHAAALQAFAGTNISITVEGKRYLGAAIGSKTYTEQYVSAKVQSWIQEVVQLAGIATSQPHAAFVHGFSSRWTYLYRTIPDNSDLLQPLEDTIHQIFIPSLNGRPPCSKLMRPNSSSVRLGGLGIINPATIQGTDSKHQRS